MSTTTRIPGIGVTLGFLLAMISCALPSPSRAAWVNSSATQFQVGGKLAEIVPTLVSTPAIPNSPPLVNPTCSQGGTSLALVRGSKLAGVDPVLFPIVLVVSCIDSNATVGSRLNFINPSQVAGTVIVNGTPTNVSVPAGAVVKQISTSTAPSTGWAHLVHRPDKGDLLGCGGDGSLYKIDYSQTNTVIDGTATKLSTPVLSGCGGLAWDAENDKIYQGVPANGKKIGNVVRFTEGALQSDASFTTNLSCEANGLAISGGVMLVSCAGLVGTGPSATLVILRLDKNTGANLGLYSSISLPVPGSTASGFMGLTSLGNADPGLGDLACDPVTFQRDPSQKNAINPLGRDLYRDAVWSRRGANGNGVAAVEFPAFTCGLPSNSVAYVQSNGASVPFSPLAAGLSTGTSISPGQSPLMSCFTDSNGVLSNIVIDADGDGLPDCWERNKGGSTGVGGIDFDGDGTTDLTLCAQVNTNGDATIPPALTQECADPTHKDLFVEVGWMDNHRPDPLALSQPNPNNVPVAVQSVREAFRAAPVFNPDNNAAATNGIRLHIQVDKQAVTFLNSTGTATTSHVTNVALTPCTGPASSAPSPADAADYDAIKATNFGKFDAANPPSAMALNAMRLAFRYVLFAHNLVGNPSGGSGSSGCAEVGGDDAVVSLGSATTTIVPFPNGISHQRGSTDEQAGTFMHEFGHLLGLEHGGEDTINNKPNYRSVMSYSRQFSDSPIPARRLDYSRSEVDLNEASLNECAGIGTLASDPTLAPILPFFPSADQIAFGPGALSVVTPTAPNPPVSAPCSAGLPINWNRQNQQGKVFQTSTSADINGDGVNSTLFGSNDWANVLYRFSAAIDFAGGRSETPFTPGTTSEMTIQDATDFFLRKDVDGNLIGDGKDCGGTISLDANGVPTTSFPCTHRIDIKPSVSLPKVINLGNEATVSIVIFSEKNGSSVWNAAQQVVTLTNGCTAFTYPCLTFRVENVVKPVKTNQNGQGTCSAGQDFPDPVTLQIDGIVDFKCQFLTSGLPSGTHFGVVFGFFVDPLDNNAVKAFSARQEVTILP